MLISLATAAATSGVIRRRDRGQVLPGGGVVEEPVAELADGQAAKRREGLRGRAVEDQPADLVVVGIDQRMVDDLAKRQVGQDELGGDPLALGRARPCRRAGRPTSPRWPWRRPRAGRRRGNARRGRRSTGSRGAPGLRRMKGTAAPRRLSDPSPGHLQENPPASLYNGLASKTLVHRGDGHAARHRLSPPRPSRGSPFRSGPRSRISSAYAAASRDPGVLRTDGAEAAAQVLQAAVHGRGDRARVRPALRPLRPGPQGLAALGRGLRRPVARRGRGSPPTRRGTRSRMPRRYPGLMVRNAIVPIAGLGSTIFWILILAGLFLGMFRLILAGIYPLSITVVLPAHQPARRIRRQPPRPPDAPLQRHDRPRGRPGVGRVLNAAAWTYVAATLTGLMTLHYLVQFRGWEREPEGRGSAAVDCGELAHAGPAQPVQDFRQQCGKR